MLRRLLHQTKSDEITLRRSRSLFSVTAPGSFELVTALIDASYPAYRAIMPRGAGNSATCQRAELLGALARLEPVASGLVRLSWEEGDTDLLVSLPQQPDAGVDTLAAQTIGRASMAFDLARLAPIIREFDNDAVCLDVTERALLIRQGEKTGVLACCRWDEKDAVAAA